MSIINRLIGQAIGLGILLPTHMPYSPFAERLQEGLRLTEEGDQTGVFHLIFPFDLMNQKFRVCADLQFLRSQFLGLLERQEERSIFRLIVGGGPHVMGDLPHNLTLPIIKDGSGTGWARITPARPVGEDL